MALALTRDAPQNDKTVVLRAVSSPILLHISALHPGGGPLLVSFGLPASPPQRSPRRCLRTIPTAY